METEQLNKERETMMKQKPSEVYFCVNRNHKTAELLTGFGYWELVQSAFRWGIRMSDGNPATGIGRRPSVAAFERDILNCGATILKG